MVTFTALMLVSLLLLLAPSTFAFSIGLHHSHRSLCTLLCFMKNNDNIQENHEDSYMQEQSDNQDSLSESLAPRFATGKTLEVLRSDIASLRETLVWAAAVNDTHRCADLKKAIKEGEAMDPDVAYRKTQDIIKSTKSNVALTEEAKDNLLKKLTSEAYEARCYLPRFQLEGLWVGKFGDFGEQVVNVTYSGDILTATKVTGDENVPRGQVSFKVDLSPHGNHSDAYLEPIRINTSSGKATSHLPRFKGKGQMARQGFIDHVFVDGQLVMFQNHFSFVWIPSRFHVLFRRPSAEQTLRLLRDTLSHEDELDNMRTHLESCLCLDATDSIARYHAKNGTPEEPFRRITRQKDLEALGSAMDDKQVHNAFFNFWNIHKWSRYISSVLDQDTK